MLFPLFPSLFYDAGNRADIVIAIRQEKISFLWKRSVEGSVFGII